MSRLRWVLLAVVLLVGGIVRVVVAGGIGSPGEGTPVVQDRLAGAELVAGLGGDARYAGRGDQLADLRLGGPGYDDLRAYDVRTGADGTLFLVTGAAACDVIEDCYGWVVRTDGHTILGAPDSYADVAPGQAAVGPDGDAVRIGPISSQLDFDPPLDRIGGLHPPIQPRSRD